jgi:hypothetical protein
LKQSKDIIKIGYYTLRKLLAKIIKALVWLVHLILNVFLSEEFLLEYKPIHLCWWFDKHGFEVPKYFIAGTTPPSVDTDAATSVTSDGATLNGEVTAEGSSSVTSRGFTYAVTATNSDPEDGGTGVTTVTEGGTGLGTFLKAISGLSTGVQYSFKAWATSSKGTSYGSALTFTTNNPPNAPTLGTNIADTASITDTTPTFEFTGTDSESNDITYNIQIDTANTFDSDSGVSSYYFDAHLNTVPGVGDDPDLVWGSVDNAFDGSIELLNRSMTNADGSVSANYLYGKGTTAPTTGNTISQVRVRINSATDTGTTNRSAAVYTSGLGELLGTVSITDTTTSTNHTWSGYTTLSTPSGGWSWEKVNNLEVKLYTASGNYAYIWKIDVEVTSAVPLLSHTSNTETSAFVRAGDSDPFTSGEEVTYTVPGGDALSEDTYYWRVRGIDPSGSNTYGDWSTTRSFTLDTSGGGTEASSERSLYSVGSIDSSSERDIYSIGSIDSSSERSLYTEGVSTGTQADSERSLYTSGTDTSSSERGLYTTGSLGSSSERGIYSEGDDEASPTVALESPSDTGSTSDTTPSLSFTGTDSNSDEIQYQVQLDMINTFDNNNKLLGASDDTGSNLSTTYVRFLKFTASASGIMNKFSVKSGASGNIKVALYADNSGEPGDLITAMDGQAVSGSGWESVDFTPTEIENGTTYWLAHVMDTEGAVTYYAGGGVKRYKAATYATYEFPSSAGTGYSSATSLDLIAGYEISPTISADSSVSTTGFTTDADGQYPSGDTISYTVQSELPLDTYYWRVRGRDPDGSNDWGDWSSTRSFTITAGTEASSERSIYSIGDSTSSSERDVYSIGSVDQSSERDIYSIGSIDQSSERSIYTVSDNTSSSQRSIYSIGSIDSSSERSIHSVGSVDSFSERSIHTVSDNTASSERSIYSIGSIDQSSTRDIYSVADSTSSSERGIYTVSGVLANSERNIYTKGVDTSSSQRDIHTIADSTANSERNIYTQGDVSSSSERSIYTKGSDTGSSQRNIHTEGSIDQSSERSLYSKGVSTSSSERDLHTTGSIDQSSQRDIYSKGVATSSSERSLHTTGSIDQSSERDIYSSGKIATSSERGIYTYANLPEDQGQSERDIYTKAVDTSDSERSVYSVGGGVVSSERGIHTLSEALSDSQRGVYTQGASADSSQRDIYSEGKDSNSSSRDIYSVGDATSSSQRDIYTEGKDTGTSERDIYSVGSVDSSSERTIYTEGDLPNSSERSIYVKGVDTSSSQRGLFVTGSTADSSERGLYTSGGIAATSQRSIYTEGTGTGAGKLKRYNGSTWEIVTIKRYNGSDWETANLKYYDGSQWVSTN